MNYLGIDLSKRYFDVTLLTEQEEMRHKKFENNVIGYKQLVNWLKEQRIQECHVCMEATNVYWEGVTQHLYEKGYQVSVINPSRIKGHGMSRMQRNKTDKIDSAVIADFCRVHKPRLWTPPTAEEKQLRNFVRQRQDFVEMQTQEKNRLADCTCEESQNRLKRHLDFLKREIEAIEKQIRTHIAAHPALKHSYYLLHSVKGLGEIASWTILGEMSDMAEYEDASAAAADAGVTPSHHQSGDTVHRKTRLSKIGKAAIRGVLYLPALAAMRFNPIIKSFAQRLEKKGKPKKVIIVAVMHKLIHLAYGVLKNNKPFDPLYNSHNYQKT